MESFKTRKFLATVLLIAALLVPVSAYYTGSQWTVIQSCDATPFCINTTQFNQPQIRAGQFLPSDPSIFASWDVNATGSRGTWDVRILTNSTNPNVAEVASGNQSVEINIKGIIPNSDTEGHPFWIQNGTTNPKTCQGSFISGSSSCYFSADVNATGAFGNYTTFFISNSTNPNVGRTTSSNITVEIVEFVKDSTPPKWRNLKINDSNSVIYNETLNISVEVNDKPDGGSDGASGLDKAILATNETGQFQNYTGGTYDSPENFGGQSDKWIIADFKWSNTSIKRKTVGYKVWVSDLNGNWNVTDVKTFYVGKKYKKDFKLITEGTAQLGRENKYNRDAESKGEIGINYNRTSSYTREATNFIQNLLEYDRTVTFNRIAVVDTLNNIAFDRTYNLIRQFQTLSQNILKFDRTRVSVRNANVSTQSDLNFNRDIIYTRNPIIKAVNDLVFDRTYNLSRSFQIKGQNKLRVDRTRIARRFFSIPGLVDLAFDTTRTYKRKGKVQTTVDIGFDRTLGFKRSFKILGQSVLDFDRTKTTFREFQASTQSTLNFNRDVTYKRNFLLATLNRLVLNMDTAPRITDVEIEINSLGNGREVFLNVNVTDDDGLNTREVIEYENQSYKIPDGTGQVVEFNITDSLEHNGTIVVTDSSNLRDRYRLKFSFTDNAYSGTGDNLSVQTITKNDTLTVDLARDPTSYNIEHETFNADNIITGGNFTGTLNPGQTADLDTKAQGDFLREERKWVQRESKLSTVQTQYIRERISIENLPMVSWENVTVPERQEPTGFGSKCDDCKDRQISFDGNYFNAALNLDSGDAILESFDKKIEDVVIGERETYFEQYRYVPESPVTLTDVQHSLVINDSEYDFGSYIQVARGNRKFDNGTLRVNADNSCDTNNPGFTKGQFYGDTWKSCSEDNNGNIKPEYFKTQIQRINKAVYVRYGGFKGTLPKDAVKPFLGLKPCKPLGNSYTTADGSTLVCYDPPECSVDGNSVTCGRDSDGSSDNVYLLQRDIVRKTVDRSLTFLQIFEALGFATMVLMVTGTWLYRKEYGEYPPGIRTAVKKVNKIT